MARKDPRIDAYISKAQPFAQPILRHIRAAVASASPELEETVKWGHPTFAYHGNICTMAAFKQHVTLGFWKSKLLLDKDGKPAGEAWGQFGRISKVSDLPSKRELVGFVKKAMQLNVDGVAVKRVAKPKKPIRMPVAFKAALAKVAKAKAFFAALPPGHQREYLEWVTEAKTDATRDKRIATAIEWLSEGKHRNWKYART